MSGPKELALSRTDEQWEHAEWALAAHARGEYNTRHHKADKYLAEYRALFAYRDEVAAGLSPLERRMLFMVRDGNLHKAGNQSQRRTRQRLGGLGLLGMDDRQRVATPFGRAVARKLEAL